MTVINNDARDQYTATGGQTIFNYTFEISDQDNIQVYQRAAAADPDDAADILTLTTDYTVTGVGVNTGGTIVLVSGATNGDIVTLQGNAPAVRSTSFTPGGVIQAGNLNTEFDDEILIYQTILAALNFLTPKYPKSAIVQGFDLVLPVLEANETWVMNAAGTEIITGIFLDEADVDGIQFVLNTPDALLPAAQSLSNLSTGIVRNTTTTGILSIDAAMTAFSNLAFAANKLPYATGASSFSMVDFTAYSQTLLPLVDASAWRVALGVGATAGPYFVLANNLSDGNAATMRTNLGLVIGTNVQAYDATLQSLSALGTAADRYAYTTGVDTWAEGTISSYSRTILPLANLAAWQVALGIPGGGGAYFAIANNLSEGVPATMRTNLGLVIGTDVQAYDATLQSISALGTAADKMIYTTGVDTWAEAGITALGRSLIDDATQADMNTTIGSVPLAGGTMTGALYLSGSPTLGLQAATKSYVDSLSLNDEIACLCMTETAQLAAWTYNNGVLGVGATITANINGATIFDGITPVDTNRVLVNLQTGNETWQGAYTIVQGTGGTPTVLTRATDYDVPGEISAGDVFAVVQGTLYGASQWMNSQIIDPVIIGTTPITFTQLAGMGALLKANNLSDLPSAATARVNLGLVIGTNVQAQDATLQSISALGTAANKMIYTTGLDTWAEADITALGRTLLADATAADMRNTMDALGEALTSAQIFVGSAGNIATGVAMSGDATIANTGALTIANSAVSNAKMANMADQTIKGNVSGGSAAPSDLTATQVRTMLGLENAAPNIIIGGNFTTNPWQRGTSLAAVPNGAYLPDRFQWASVGSGVVTISKTADAPTVAQAGAYTQHCLQVDVTTADASLAASDVYAIQYNVEGFDMSEAGFGQSGTRYVTFSFWHKHTKTGIYSLAIGNQATNRSYVKEYSQAVSDTWELATLIFPVDTSGTWAYDNTIGLRVYFAVATGSTYAGSPNSWNAAFNTGSTNQVNAMDSTSNFIRLALVKLELGSVATPYPIELYEDIFANCRRYYQHFAGLNSFIATGYAANTSQVYLFRQLTPPMRTSPTVSYSTVGEFTILFGAAGSGATAVSMGNNSAHSVQINATGTGTPFTANQAVMFYNNNGTTAFLGLSAEL